jgi:hypothetical protein
LPHDVSPIKSWCFCFLLPWRQILLRKISGIHRYLVVMKISAPIVYETTVMWCVGILGLRFQQCNQCNKIYRNVCRRWSFHLIASIHLGLCILEADTWLCCFFLC